MRQMMVMRQKNAGFTLVEIAIVLVIIGLLLGGVLKGQEMITNAKIKRVVNDFKGISAAVFTYQDRYNALPGDDSKADVHIGVPATDNGNGNGLLGGKWNSTKNGNETRKVWKHLRASGIIAGNGYDQPTHAYGGIIGIEDSIYNLKGQVVCFDNITGDIARIVDSQNDDGIPNTGSIQASTTATAYVDTTTYDPCFKM